MDYQPPTVDIEPSQAGPVHQGVAEWTPDQAAMAAHPQQQEVIPTWVNLLLQQVRTDIRTETDTIRREFRVAATTAPALQSTTPAAANVLNVTPRTEYESHPRQKLPNPKKFDGVRKEYKPWLSQMKAKLDIDFSNESDNMRFWYVHSRLDSGPISNVQSWVDQVDAGARTDTLFFRHLNVLYDDPMGAQNAVTRLKKLKQNTRSFGAYLLDFERTLTDAGGNAWPDDAKKAWLSNGLSDEIVAARVSSVEPASYLDFVNDLHNTASNIYAIRKGGCSHKDPVAPVRDEDAMDWVKTNSAKARKTALRAAVAAQKSVRAKWATPAVREARRATRQCIRCGGDDHFQKDCPFVAAMRPVAAKRGKPTTQSLKTEESSDENDDSVIEKSENEEPTN